MRRFVSLAAFAAAAVFLGLVAPSSAFATTHWTRTQAQVRYLQIVRPLNKELDVWFVVAHSHATLHAMNNEAANVASAEITYVQRLIEGSWPARDIPLAEKLEVRSLREVDGWQAVATAQTGKELRKAMHDKISSAGLATEFRKALGLPPPT
jgi:hypothetical protein